MLHRPGAAAGEALAQSTSAIAATAGVPPSRCIVYSMGSYGLFEYEEAVLNSSRCDVYTMDCTFNGTDLPQYKGRHHYLPWCLGTPAAAAGRRAALQADATPHSRSRREAAQASLHGELQGAAALASPHRRVAAGAPRRRLAIPPMIPGGRWMGLHQMIAELGHSHTHVAAMKIDIEGYEHQVLGSLHLMPPSLLPLQISVELHFSTVPVASKKIAEMALFFSHMAHLGYAAVSKEDNLFGEGCCAEYTFLRVAMRQ